MGEVKMLQFIFGRAASGKTTYILNKMQKLSEEGRETVLILPEQYTFEGERAVLHALGDKAALNTLVTNFTRLYDELTRIVGRSSAKVLSDSDKLIFMNETLKRVKPDLKIWDKYSSSFSFAKTMVDTVSELKINDISPERLNNAGNLQIPDSLKRKLYDLAVIYENYNLLLGEKFIDSTDKLSRLYDMLIDTKYFRGKTVFIDAFKGWTGIQFRVLERIIATADNVYITFCDDIENQNELNIFTNIRKSVLKIRNIAKKYGVDLAEDVVLSKPYFNNPALHTLEEFISGKENYKKNENPIKVFACKSVFDEAQACANKIRELVKEKGLRFRDFVIITRDAEAYWDAVSLACKKNGINCFYDARMPLSAFPLAKASEFAIKATSLSTDAILGFHKTGMGTLSPEEIAILQNYTYVWDISGDAWVNDWVMDPRGLTTDEDKSGRIKAELDNINLLRKKAITPILNFKNSLRGTTKEMCKALIDLFKECDSFNNVVKLSDYFKENNVPYVSFEALKQAYDSFISLIDSLVACNGEKQVSKLEFSQMLSFAISSSSIGVIPQMLDEVTFGSADRIRPSRPKIVFILGANYGVFPKPVSTNGVLSLSDRKALIANDFEIADNSVYSSIDEEFLIYSNLCSASDDINISYSHSSIKGATLEKSTFLKEICEKLNVNEISYPEEKLGENYLPQTAVCGYAELCKRNNEDSYHTLKEALLKFGYDEKLKWTEEDFYKGLNEISRDTAKKLYGKDIRLSASKLDKFSACKFSFFCQYGLGVRKLQPASFDVMQRGTIIHYVLERLIVEYGENISSLTKEKCALITDKFIAEYLDLVGGYRAAETSRLKFLVTRISRSLKEVVYHVVCEISQSDFKPVGCEVKIGNDEDVSLSFPFDTGNITISGSVDRVDKYNGYIRIIDYKSGSKTFKLSDTLSGLNMQMLIYLYALTRGSGKSDSLAAGILYQPSKRNLDGKPLTMNGLLVLDDDLARAMEKDMKGQFVPALSKTQKGTYSATSLYTYIERNGFSEIFDHIEKYMRSVGNSLVSGDITVHPVDGYSSEACKYCDFASVCNLSEEIHEKAPTFKNDEVLKIMKGDIADA